MPPKANICNVWAFIAPDAVHILLLGLTMLPSVWYNYPHFTHEEIKTMLKYR